MNIAARFVVRREAEKSVNWRISCYLLLAGMGIRFFGFIVGLLCYFLVGCFLAQPHSNMHPGFESRKVAFQGPK